MRSSTANKKWVRLLGTILILVCGGEEIYHFKALKAGGTQIKLTYKRSWEATPSDQTTIFFVRISNP